MRFGISSTLQSLNENFENVLFVCVVAYKKMTTFENWTKTVLFVCVVALAIDPLFLFIPVIDSHRFCFTLDKKLGAAVCVLRTFIDTFYVIHIIFHLCTGLIAPRYQRSLRGEIILHSDVVRERPPLFYFIVDIVSVLPIPQVVVLVLIQIKQKSGSLETKEILKWVIFFQYIPRSIRIYPIFKEVTRVSGTVAKTKWKGAVLNLFLYMLPSHVIGAFWYLVAIETKERCWRGECDAIFGCNVTYLYCGRGHGDNRRFLNTSCPLIEPDQIANSTVFNFGIYIDALKSGVVESRDFPMKFIYCFLWGLRNLSALGQNLETSKSLGELIFTTIICVSGLLLFAVLIGNVQKYLQSTTIKVDELEEKKRDTENWMSYRMLPEDLKDRIRRYEDYKWQETRGVDEETLLSNLPKDLRKDIKQHLCLDLVKRVPWFNAMDDRLLNALCARLKTVLYTENSYIVREGEPVEDMLFIMRGILISSTTYGGKRGFFNSVRLSAGEFCGDDLLTWAIDPNASHFPISSRTVQAQTEVEGFVLSVDDLKSVSSQYRRLHSKQLRHMFRYYSVQWQTWAACFIQAAWRRHCRRKISKALREEEGKLQNTLEELQWRTLAACFIQAAWRKHCKRKLSKILHTEGDNQQIPQNTQLNHGATLYVSRFVSKSLLNVAGCSSSSHMLPPIPRKPAYPKFSKNE